MPSSYPPLPPGVGARLPTTLMADNAMRTQRPTLEQALAAFLKRVDSSSLRNPHSHRDYSHSLPPLIIDFQDKRGHLNIKNLGDIMGLVNGNNNKLDVDLEFRSLINDVVSQYSSRAGFGCMTAAIYDTAWLACVRSADDELVFPESFGYLWSAQNADGAWSHNADASSRILDSLASLFALVRYREIAPSPELEQRIACAQRQIEKWTSTFRGTGGVGFEMIVPCLLNLLSRELIHFTFPARENILKLRAAKLARIPTSLLYESSTPLLHSLEAFFDDPDFDYNRFTKHKTNGSMMASPSSTAAYLMRTSVWDHEAEVYLRSVIQHGAGKGSGAVPSAFPSTTFETAWMLSTCLTAGFDLQELPPAFRDMFTAIYKASGAVDGKCVAFAPGLEPDLDDTARMSLAASLLGLPMISASMIARFETKTHLETYKYERNPSFSANCNALLAILTEPISVLRGLKSTMQKIVTFLCKDWSENSRLNGDKWNISPHYAPMLMAEAFTRLIEIDATCRDQSLVDIELLEEDIPRALIQVAIRTLRTQKPDGSWGDLGSNEETAYAVIELAQISRLPHLRSLSVHIGKAIDDGKAFLGGVDLTAAPERLWVEKVLYGSHLLCKSYVLAALKINIGDSSRKADSEAVPTPPELISRKTLKLLETLPLHKGYPHSWLLEASRLEAQTFLPTLQRTRGQVFHREGFTDDKYLEWVPIIWTLANNSLSGPGSSKLLEDMMRVSVVNFQMDEFMESIMANELTDHESTIELYLQDFFEAALENNTIDFDLATETQIDHRNEIPIETNRIHEKPRAVTLPQRAEPLRAFVGYVLSHVRVRNARKADRQKLFSELSNFISAHIAQNKDNRAFADQRLKRKRDEDNPIGVRVFQPLNKSFHQWVRGTAANHTSCPYSFAYAICIAQKSGQELFSSTEQRYVADEVCRHLATMCRLYNDAGSLMRDMQEGNLNGANFPEVHLALAIDKVDDNSAIYRDRLLEIASFERAMMETALVRLDRAASSEAMDLVRLFVRVTDMFGEIYILKDLASRNVQAVE